MTIKHLPYDADEATDSRWYHEHYWKVRALQLLLANVPEPTGWILDAAGASSSRWHRRQNSR